jgi:hypothetical protein
MRRALEVFLGCALALGAEGCVETATFEKVQGQLDEAQRAAAQKDQQIRVLQWQLGVLDQQFRASEQRHEVAQQAMHAEVQRLGAANLELGERINKEARDRAALLAAASAPLPSSTDPKGAHAPPRPEDLRRMLLTFDARNTQILEELARIERLLANRPPRADPPPRERPTPGGDVIDPWGFGSRK